jgi:hypothetical protein
MRKNLQSIDGERLSFTGTVSRYGGKGGGRYTVLIVDVTFLDGRPATDHLWFNLTLGFKKLRLQPGERVSFDARVKPYTKGYQGRKQGIDRPVSCDYKLSHPTKVRRAG